jgi:hypothetical protein
VAHDPVKPKSFLLQELVPPDIYAARGERAWELLDPRALITLQSLRDALGPCIVNDWHKGGPHKESGLRSFHTPTGAVYSQHRFGRGFDCKFKSVSPHEAMSYVMANYASFPHLTVIENPNATPTWFHFDTRLTSRPDIWVVNP